MGLWHTLAGHLQQLAGRAQMLAGHHTANPKLETAGVILELKGRLRTEPLLRPGVRRARAQKCERSAQIIRLRGWQRIAWEGEARKGARRPPSSRGGA